MAPWNFDSDELILAHLDLARRMARGIGRRCRHDPGDLIGDACYGLVLAARTYDADRGVPFGAWAAIHIRGEVYGGIRRWLGRHTVPPRFVSLSDWLEHEET